MRRLKPMAKTTSNLAKVEPQPEFRVYLRKECLINRPPPIAEAAGFSPLLALFVPKLIELAIGGVAMLLKKAGADKTLQAEGSEFAPFYVADKDQALQINPDLGCVLGIYGIFSDEDGEPWDPKDEALKALEREGLVEKNADIAIVFEAAIVPSPDGTAFFLEARHFSIREFIGGKDGERGLVATLAVSTASATADGDTIAIGHIDFGKLKRGADVVPGGTPIGAYPRFRSNLMPWGRISEASKTAYDADVAAKRAAGKRYMPVTLTLTLSQTEKGYPLLVKLGELLEGAKKEAAAEIAKLVLPEERDKAEAERAKAAEKLYEAEGLAQVDVAEAQKNLDAGTPEEKPVLQAKLRNAQRKLAHATALRKAAGLPDPPA